MTPRPARRVASPRSRCSRWSPARRSCALARRGARSPRSSPTRAPPAPAGVARPLPEVLSRGVPATLPIEPPAPPAAASTCARRARPPWLEPREGVGGWTASSSRAGAGATLPASPRARGPCAWPAGTTRWRGRRAPRLPRPARRPPARARRRPRALPRPGRDGARPARARHRVRVDPRLPARRRHPPGQLAGDRAARAADEQPVPDRAGPRPALLLDAGRLLAAPLSGGHDRLDVALDAAAAVGARRRRARRPLRHGGLRRRGPRRAAAAPGGGAGPRAGAVRPRAAAVDTDYELAFRRAGPSARS